MRHSMRPLASITMAKKVTPAATLAALRWAKVAQPERARLMKLAAEARWRKYRQNQAKENS